MVINMSEHEPQDAREWEELADKKYDEIKKTIKRIETKGSSQSIEKNLKDAARGFGDMLISLGGLAYGVASDVTEKATGEDAVALQQDLAKKANAARNIIADEMDKVSHHLRSKKEGPEMKETPAYEPSEETSDIT
jgi:hypothetical protein